MICPQCTEAIHDENAKCCSECGFCLATDAFVSDKEHNEPIAASSEVKHFSVNTPSVPRKSIVARVVWSFILMGLATHGCIATGIVWAMVKYDCAFLGTTFILGAVSVIVLLTGVSILTAACNYKKRAAYGLDTTSR